MNIEDVREWRANQYGKYPSPLLQFDVDCIDWLIAEVERLQTQIKGLNNEQTFRVSRGR